MSLFLVMAVSNIMIILQISQVAKKELCIFLGTGSQIVPSILPEVKHLTQIVRSKHWIFPMRNIHYSSRTKWIFHNIPLAMRMQRFLIYLLAERSWPLFQMTKKGTELRQQKRAIIENYMRKSAPAKYHDLLIPDFEIGCKVSLLNK